MATQPKVSRPSQHKQSSRKGKKAWRKNIDLSDIEKGIEEKIDQEITHGVEDISKLQNDALFQVDEAGDDDLKNKLIKRKQIKNLKSREILDAVKTNSKVSALKHHKHHHNASDDKVSTDGKKKVQGVSKYELTKLMALAGKIQGESKLKNRSAKEGLVKSGSMDLWGSEPPTKVKKQKTLKEYKTPAGIAFDVESRTEIPESLLTQSTTGWSIPSSTPSTSKIAPIQIRKYDEVPHAGKSYNPESKAWNALLSKEYETEKVNEEKRVQLAEYRERIKHLMETLDDNEESSSASEGEDHVSEEDDEEEDGEIRLSINEPVENKKKTKYQRNKAKRHEDKVKLHLELKKLKQHVKELENLDEIEESVQIDIKTQTKVKITKKRKLNRNKLGTKYGILDERLEIKFSDELSDSLRKLKPEGNLLYDNVRKLQSSGKIESRVPIKRASRYKQNITEKWTYKDFK